jgi:hypothetical protein
VLGAAVVGSVLLLTALSAGSGQRRYADGDSRRPRGLRAQDRSEPDRAQEEGDDEIPVLHDVVQPEVLRRPAAEPPVLTDEVLPGRREQ